MHFYETFQCVDRIASTFKSLMARNSVEKVDDLSVHVSLHEKQHSEPCEMEESKRSFNQEEETEVEEVHYLDKICRYLMPLLYLIFLVTHFGHFLSFHGGQGKQEGV